MIALSILGARYYATDHASAQDALAGRRRETTPPRFPLLVGRARRWTSLVTQLHMEVAGALEVPATAPSVFATRHGEIQTAERLIGEFREGAQVSSAHFAQSVHNTPSGLYSVATGNRSASTTITGANAVAAGWLEAALIAREVGGPVLLSIADEPVPAAFTGPDEPGGIAAAFLVTPGDAARLTIVDGAASATDPMLLARLALAQPGTTFDLGVIRPGATLRLSL